MPPPRTRSMRGSSPSHVVDEATRLPAVMTVNVPGPVDPGWEATCRERWATTDAGRAEVYDVVRASLSRLLDEPHWIPGSVRRLDGQRLDIRLVVELDATMARRAAASRGVEIDGERLARRAEALAASLRPEPSRMGPARKVSDDQILGAIDILTNQDGYPPSLRALADRVGLASTSSLQRRLLALRSAGRVAWVDKAPRTLRVL